MPVTHKQRQARKRTDYLKYIKEDGRLNVEKIRHLPIDEKMKVMGKMTQEQIDEYWSKIPINESQNVSIKITGRYKMKDRGVDAFEVLEKIRKAYERK